MEKFVLQIKKKNNKQKKNYNRIKRKTTFQNLMIFYLNFLKSSKFLENQTSSFKSFKNNEIERVKKTKQRSFRGKSRN